jgi:glycosyltransferase involved in cell wall biosynthesis
MKVVQLLPELNEGGVERGTVDLNREFVKRSIHSVVISNGGKLVPQLLQDGGEHVQIDVCSKNILTAPWRIWQLYRALKTLSPDILHVRSRVPAWMVFFANKALKLPVVSTVHGFNSVSFYSAIMTKADRVICVSNAIKEHVQAHYQTPEHKLRVIPRGVDLAQFNLQNINHAWIKEAQEKWELEDALVVTSVGRITQLKDYETFIEAIALLRQTCPRAKGLIVGGVREDKHAYFETLKQHCEALHVNDAIIFTGSQSHIAEIYALSDVVVSSSKKPESFGRAVAEALALNTPVIATRHGGVLDIIREGENGAFVPIGNAKVLAEAIERVKALRFYGAAYIRETFSLETMREKTLTVYGEFRCE